MTQKELLLLERFAGKYNVDVTPSEGKYDFWDFTYEWDGRKFYCEMKARNFSLDYAKEKYSDGLILEMHKYERLLRRSKNETSAQGLYINFFDCGSVLIHNLNKYRVDKWKWRTLPESTEFGRKKFVYKYITYIDYDKGKLLYI